MPRPDLLGQFELYVLAALEQLGDDAYGVTIRAEIEERSRRRTSHGAVYTTVERLAEKGYVSFWISEPQPVQGGRARKYVRLTGEGRRAFRESIRSLDRMLSGLRVGLGASGGGA